MAIPRSVAATILAVSLGTGAAARADTFRLLDDPTEAARARVALIQAARHEIDATYFIVGNDSVSLGVLTLLRDAARRGITVRLLVDAQWNAIPKAVQAQLVGEGVAIREYHPFRPWRPRWWTRRLHDKLLIVDGEHLVVGGRNIESPYYGRGREIGRRDYIDRDAYVRGRAAAEARDYFLAVWASPKVAKTHLGDFRADLRARPCDLVPERDLRHRCASHATEIDRRFDDAAEVLDDQRRVLDGDDLFTAGPEGDGWLAGREVGTIRFLHDPPTGKKSGDGIGEELLALLDAAKVSVIIESPYLVPSRALRRALQNAAGRGVRIRILTNSLASTDNLFPQAGYVGKKDNIVRWGVELWEFVGPDCLHSKSAVIDGHITVVGSFNLDPRSEYLNSEVAVVVDDPEVAAEALVVMDANLARALRIGPDGKPIASDVKYPSVPFRKKLLLTLLRILAPFIHKQL